MTSPGRGQVVWLLFGVAALVFGTLLGTWAELLDAIAQPPALIRAALVGGSVVLGLWLLAEAVRRLRAGRRVEADEMTGGDLAALVRGVRYIFLAVAAFSAAAGWLVGHPLPFVVALVIAGVDVLETTFLLIVVSFRSEP
jgi:hypothetical protein